MDFSDVGSVGGGDFGIGSSAFTPDVGPVGAAPEAPANPVSQGFSGDSSFEPAQRSRPLVDLNPSLSQSQQIEAVRRSSLPAAPRRPGDQPQTQDPTVSPVPPRPV